MAFNWKYKAGATLPNGTVVPTTADNVRPGGMAYVAAFGNDDTGNGSRNYPYRTLNKAATIATTIIVDNTPQYQQSVNQIVTIISDGFTILDGTNTAKLSNASGNINQFYSCLIRKYATITGAHSATFNSCILEGITANFDNVNITSNANLITRTLIKECVAVLGLNSGGVGYQSFNTFYNSSLSYHDTLTRHNVVQNSIYSKCDIRLNHALSFSYCVFAPDCRFAFGAGAFTTYATIEALRTAWRNAFSQQAITPFDGCQFADPKFNDIANSDFTLAFDSPARNAGFNGKAIGAYGIAKKTGVATAEYTENITITGGIATLTDASLNGVIRLPIQDLAAEYPLGAINITGVFADRNGEYFDIVKDLAATATTAAEPLAANTAYVVELGTINYNGTMYNLGTRFTTVAGVTAFTTTEGGVCREIIETPNRHTVRLKTSRSIGTVEHFDTLAWHEYELRQKVTANRAGDLGTGAILRGNGAVDFDRTPAKVLPVFARYYQVEIVIQTNALRS